MKKLIILIALLSYLPTNLFAEEKIIDFRLVYENQRPGTYSINFKNIDKFYVGKRSMMSISDILRAKVTVDREEPPEWMKSAVEKSGGKFGIFSPQVYIDITFTEEGKSKFAELTSTNIGKRLAVFIYGEIVMAPMIMEKIDSGEARITTDFTEEEANNLANTINNR